MKKIEYGQNQLGVTPLLPLGFNESDTELLVYPSSKEKLRSLLHRALNVKCGDGFELLEYEDIIIYKESQYPKAVVELKNGTPIDGYMMLCEFNEKSQFVLNLLGSANLCTINYISLSDIGFSIKERN